MWTVFERTAKSLTNKQQSGSTEGQWGQLGFLKIQLNSASGAGEQKLSKLPSDTLKSSLGHVSLRVCWWGFKYVLECFSLQTVPLKLSKWMKKEIFFLVFHVSVHNWLCPRYAPTFLICCYFILGCVNRIFMDSLLFYQPFLVPLLLCFCSNSLLTEMKVWM